MSIDIGTVTEVLREQNVDATIIKTVVTELQKVIADEKAAKVADTTPRAKYQYAVVVNSPTNDINNAQAWIVKLPDAENPQDILLCSVVKAELFYGAMKSLYPEANLAKQKKFADCFVSLPFLLEGRLLEVLSLFYCFLSYLPVSLYPISADRILLLILFSMFQMKIRLLENLQLKKKTSFHIEKIL